MLKLMFVQEQRQEQRQELTDEAAKIETQNELEERVWRATHSGRSGNTKFAVNCAMEGLPAHLVKDW
jgi:hypothetical protein